MKSKLNSTIDDIISHLEDKIGSDTATDAEYGLYIDFQEMGAIAFQLDEHREAVLRLRKEVRKLWGL